MILGIQAILASGKYGMPASHLEGLSLAAEQLGTAIAIRNVSTLSTSFLEAGYPTKPFSVKNKTSQTGPMAGLIAADPEFSRETTGAGFVKHKRQLAEAKHHDTSLINVDLILTKERIEELSELKAMEYKNNSDGSISLTWESGGKKQTAIAIQNEEGTYAIFTQINGQKGKPIQVLGKELENKKALPITTDYDLFLVAPPHGELGKLDQIPHRVQGRSITSTRGSVITNSREVNTKGNISLRLNQILKTLNNFIALKDAKRAIPTEKDKKTSDTLKAEWIEPERYTVYLKTIDKLPVSDLETLKIPTLLKYQDDKQTKYYLWGLKETTPQGEPKLELTELKADRMNLDFKDQKEIIITKEHELHKEIASQHAHLTKTILYSARSEVGKSIQEELKVFHHNQEINNPFADPLKQNIPLLFILPRLLPGYTDRVVLADSPAEVIQLHRALITNGYYFPSHADYKQFSPFNTPINDSDLQRVIDNKARQPDHKSLSEPKVQINLDEKLNVLMAKLSSKLIDIKYADESTKILHQRGYAVIVEQVNKFFTKNITSLSLESVRQFYKEMKKATEQLKEWKFTLPHLIAEEEVKSIRSIAYYFKALNSIALKEHSVEEISQKIPLRKQYVEVVKELKDFLKDKDNKISNPVMQTYQESLENINKQLSAWQMDPSYFIKIEYEQKAAPADLIQGRIGESKKGKKGSIGRKEKLENLITQLDNLMKKDSPTNEEQKTFKKLCSELREKISKYAKEPVKNNEPYLTERSLDFLHGKLEKYESFSPNPSMTNPFKLRK